MAIVSQQMRQLSEDTATSLMPAMTALSLGEAVATAVREVQTIPLGDLLHQIEKSGPSRIREFVK